MNLHWGAAMPIQRDRLLTGLRRRLLTVGECRCQSTKKGRAHGRGQFTREETPRKGRYVSDASYLQASRSRQPIKLQARLLGQIGGAAHFLSRRCQIIVTKSNIAALAAIP